MPQLEGGYVSLTNTPNATNVYKSTTEPTGPQSVFESMKRVIGSAIGNNSNTNNNDGALSQSKGGQTQVLSPR